MNPIATKNLMALTGNEAGAYAMKQINPDVVAAFPITPQTELMHSFADYVANGEVDTELVTVESEHSAMSVSVGAGAAGARVMTATSANGLALMWEILYIAASTRLPIIMAVANRALSGPINIHCDHSDAMGARDSGWIQLWSENSQEVYDNIIQAVKIAENHDVLLPVMVNYDGFIISHAVEAVKIYDTELVKKFIGEYKPKFSLLDTSKPLTVGPLDLQDYYFEHKRQQAEAMKNAPQIIKEVGNNFKEIFGKAYGFFDTYRLEDAEVAIIALGSTAGTARSAVDNLRSQEKKAGLIKLRLFRPFPAKELARILNPLKGLAVLDRSDSFGALGGPLFGEVRSAMYELESKPITRNYIYGLGGRDIKTSHIEKIYNEMLESVKSGEPEPLVQYYGVRE